MPDKLLIYQPINRCEKLTVSTTFFNQTSLDFLDKQLLSSFLNLKFKRSRYIFLKYRDWLFNNTLLTDQPKYMLFSSVVLFLLGLRNCNDLDLYVDRIKDDDVEKIDENLISNEAFNFMDISIKGTKYWKHYWDRWLMEWSTNVGASSFNEILSNPKYHFHFLGVKIISIECDIKRRQLRNRPRAIADLIALNQMLGMKITIPRMPRNIYTYQNLNEISEDELSNLIKKGGKVIKENNEVELIEKVDKDRFREIN